MLQTQGGFRVGREWGGWGRGGEEKTQGRDGYVTESRPRPCGFRYSNVLLFDALVEGQDELWISGVSSSLRHG